MRKFVTTTESTSDLPVEYLEKNSIKFYEMMTTVNGEDFGGDSGKKLDTKVFFQKMRENAKTSTTQVNPDQAYRFFKSLLSLGQDVLHIGFSSGLSGTFSSFEDAAKKLTIEFPERKILVIDSKAASLGQGLLVHMAIEHAKNSDDIVEVAKYVELMKEKICHFFVVDNLQYLLNGGRVSKASAFLGTMLQIKPVLHVNTEGKLVPIKKVISRKKSLKELVSFMEEKFDKENDTVFISHGDCLDDANFVASLVKEKFSIDATLISNLGSVIGSHSGPGTVALFFVGKNKLA